MTGTQERADGAGGARGIPLRRGRIAPSPSVIMPVRDAGASIPECVLQIPARRGVAR